VDNVSPLSENRKRSCVGAIRRTLLDQVKRQKNESKETRKEASALASTTDAGEEREKSSEEGERLDESDTAAPYARIPVAWTSVAGEETRTRTFPGRREWKM